MTSRLVSLAAALALGLSVPAAALAQGIAVSSGSAVGLRESGPAWRAVPIDGVAVDARGGVSSAKAGNAAQPERLVPQYGNTSGGPGY